MRHVVLCAAMWAFMVGAVRADSGYHVTNIGTDRPIPSLNRTVISVQVGNDPLNHFDIVRVRRHGLRYVGDPPVILLAPFAFPAEFWELSTGDYEDSFGPQVALAGYDVWMVDSRLADIAPGSCESGAVDCSAMAGWTQDAAIADAMFVRALAFVAHPFKKPVIGGLSGGSSTAIATIDRHPNAFAGLFGWEGTLYTDSSAIRARNAAFCAQDEALLAAGQFFDPAVQSFKVLFQLAAAAPNDPSPIPAFPPGTTNLQALLIAFTLPNPANPLNFTEGFVRLVGDPFATTLTYSDIDKVLVWGPLVGNYAPVAFIRDSHCSMAGIETRFTDDLENFHGPVLFFTEGLGFGEMMFDTADLLTNADVTIDYHAEFGESDRYFHREWETVGLAPFLAWLGDVW
jgi:pimeloyl-ACP methyl ester carboxylesterase